jgi:hypothetical protein
LQCNYNSDWKTDAETIQAEQLAIVKVVEAIETIDIPEKQPMYNRYIHGQQNHYRSEYKYVPTNALKSN